MDIQPQRKSCTYSELAMLRSSVAKFCYQDGHEKGMTLTCIEVQVHVAFLEA